MPIWEICGPGTTEVLIWTTSGSFNGDLKDGTGDLSRDACSSLDHICYRQLVFVIFFFFSRISIVSGIDGTIEGRFWQ